MLKLRNVSVAFGSYQALRNIELEVNKGELVVLLGANGAGKSTIFRTISGLNRHAKGDIEFMGGKIGGLVPDRIVRLGISQCPEGRHLFPKLPVYKNLILGAYVHRSDKAGISKTLEEVYQLFPMLREKKDDPAGSLSGGQQQMLAIGRALMSRPKLLLLDEPSLGLSPLVVREVFEAIKQINAAGTMVLLAEQNAFMALKVASRGYVIENGQIVMADSSENLLGNEQVKRAYIGA
ncbi:leucine/isoleucine/valine transporter ATP-binding subunit [Clostridiales bacterium PH28_bin88]|nr:leucine/isoleucine/valine transporter ATP-binding subunit [Clostridiales bacterium PH28_bin88]